MALSLDMVTEISRAVVAEQTPALQVVNVASSDGGSGRVELLITVVGCHAEPCRLLLNLSRMEQRRFEHDLRIKLRDAIQSHRL
jgi:hypothetical protein